MVIHKLFFLKYKCFLTWINTLIVFFSLLMPCVLHAQIPYNSSASNSTPRTLMIGTMIFNPPFEISDQVRHVFSGFEIDILSVVCQRLNIDCKFKAVFNVIDAFNQLAEGQIDLAAASIVVLNGDMKHIFSTPYLPSSIQFFAKKNSNIKMISDVMKKRIGTTHDPFIEAFVTVNYAKSYSLKVFDTPQAGIDALASGSIDVFVMQTAITHYWLSITSNTFKLIGDAIPIGLGNGVMAMSSATDLMIQINQTLLSMQHDGTYAQIYNRYNTL